MQKGTLLINEINITNEIIKVDKELKALIQQKTQHVAGIKELNDTIKECKDKVVLKVNIPSVGGMSKVYRSDNKKILGLMQKNIVNMETAVKGIDGQITHFIDALNENVMKATYMFLERLTETGIDLKKTSLKKFFEVK